MPIVHSRNSDELLRSRKPWPRGAARVPVVVRAFLLSAALHAALGVWAWHWLSSNAAPSAARALRVELLRDAPPAKPSASQPPLPEHARADAESLKPLARRASRAARVAPPRPAADASSVPVRESVTAIVEPRAAAQVPARSVDPQPLEFRVLEWLARYRDYPLAARRGRIEGVVHLRVTLMPDGALVDARVEQSSGHVILDRAAIDLLVRASPLPPGYADAHNARVELQLPIVYRMRAASL